MQYFETKSTGETRLHLSRNHVVDIPNYLVLQMADHIRSGLNEAFEGKTTPEANKKRITITKKAGAVEITYIIDADKFSDAAALIHFINMSEEEQKEMIKKEYYPWR